jgi:glycosyltransferase involved in cell wall biosynthesis
MQFLVTCRNRVLLKADGFLSTSRVITAECEACGVPASKVCVVPNGTNTDVFRPAEPDVRAAARARLDLPADKRLFAYSGKLNKGKGLDFLLEVWKELVSGRDDAHLVLIGSGKDSFLSCENALRAFVESEGLGDMVTFTGYVGNVAEYLQCADVFVLPSDNENCSNAIIEALACGLPCLASDVGGNPDTVRDRENGRLLPARDAGAWLGAMTELLDRPELAARWGGQGRDMVVADRSIQRVAERHLEFFASLGG